MCQAYDPAFAYEMATIIEHGLHRMYGEDEDIFYYLTLYNESYVQPPKPEGSEDGILAGLYQLGRAPDHLPHRSAILFSGPLHAAARDAQTDLAEHYGVGADLFSATSYKRLREDALEAERWNRLHAGDEPGASPTSQPRWRM